MNTSIVYGLVGVGWFVTVPVAVRAANVAAAPNLAGHPTFARVRALIPAAVNNGVNEGWRRTAIALIPVAWLFAAAGWAVAAIIGINPGGFSDDLVILTAAHFVHAGFGLSMLHRLTGGQLRFGIHQAGMVGVALGINGIDWLQPIGAALLVIALGGYSLRVVRLLRGGRSRLSRVLLAISAVVWIYPMWLAVSWAFAQVGLGVVARSLDQMVAQHGVVNAIGVVLAGLIGLSLTDRNAGERNS